MTEGDGWETVYATQWPPTDPWNLAKRQAAMGHPFLRVAFLHRVLDEALPRWTALGWREVGRTGIPSMCVDDVLIRWDGETPPKP